MAERTSAAAGASQAKLIRLVERLSEVGARSEDSRDERLRAGALILAAVLIVTVSFVRVGTYAAAGYLVSALIPASYQVLTIVGLLVLARTKRFDVFRTSQLVMFLRCCRRRSAGSSPRAGSSFGRS